MSAPYQVQWLASIGTVNGASGDRYTIHFEHCERDDDRDSQHIGLGFEGRYAVLHIDDGLPRIYAETDVDEKTRRGAAPQRFSR